MKPVFFFCAVYTEGKLLLPQAKGVNMYSKTFSVAIQGIEGHMVQIEADISDGLPVFSLVGDLSCETCSCCIAEHGLSFSSEEGDGQSFTGRYPEGWYRL